MVEGVQTAAAQPPAAEQGVCPSCGAGLVAGYLLSYGLVLVAAIISIGLS